jgi:tricorn protease
VTESYLRYPHIWGDDIVFVADDDLWLVPTAGGRASRLTSERSPVRHPRFSPDGSRIAYTRIVGNVPEVFVLDLGTGEVRQVTYWGVQFTYVDGWLDDSTILVASAAGQPYRVRLWLHAVDLDGAATKLPYGTAMSAAFREDGTVAVTTPYWRDLAMWKRYRGGTAPRPRRYVPLSRGRAGAALVDRRHGR